MASSHPFPSWWGAKHYIMAAIAGTLAASAIVIVTSVVLSPTRISFSVTGGGASISRSAGDQAFLLNLTIAADNPSHRAGVQYLAFAVSLQQFTARNRMESVEATVQDGVPFYQPPASSMSVLVTALLVDKNFFGASHGGGGAGRGPPLTVVVRGQVRFKVWLAYSRPYDVAVECAPVDVSSGAGGGKTRPKSTMVKCIP
uniref:Late embryogenesis abundant protein LEA-2 subgroup domain-containing protein n=1 Tax=Oryza nivara TaxID=4536 RepID=A0A0E0HK59_ORYNI